jgi:GT2 family glycosyltransferase/glycosyltransferase involved in cell wall biosynthesis
LGPPEYSSPLLGLVHASTLRALEQGPPAGTSPASRRSLLAVQKSLHDGSLATALRDLDRAWRSLPEDADSLAPIYGRLLSLEDQDPGAALRLLQLVSAPDPDISALTIRALQSLRRGEDARRLLQRSLSDFCLMPGELLACAASEVLHHPDTQASGWFGLGPTLECTGELASSEPTTSLQVRIGTGAEYTQLIAASAHSGRLLFRFKLPQWTPDTPIHVSCRGVPLLGSGALRPATFGLDGRAAAIGQKITGWARLGWMPSQSLHLRFEDEGGRSHSEATGRKPPFDLRWPFRIDRRRTKLRGPRIQISAQLPDGRWQPLPDAPLLLESAVRLSRRVAAPTQRPIGQPAAPATKWCDVIIPVFRGLRESLACIDSVLSTVDKRCGVIVINDASDDSSLATALEELAADKRIILLTNAVNQGFVASVIRALALHPDDDAVLLNSDTQVFGDWLPRLRAAAYSAARVGTVTPLTNSGTIASYPRTEEQAISPEDAAAIHRLAATVNDGVRADIPVGVGFCLYLRRDCLKDVGEFDAAVFGRGYGEETDFCMRARRRGWSHRLAADVYVYHAGGLSFGVGRAALLDRSQRLLNLRYSGYARSIAKFVERDPLLGLRRDLDAARLREFEGQFVLLVTLAMTGGVERFVAERCQAIRQQGLFPLLLRPQIAGDARSCELWTDAIDVPSLRFQIPGELPALKALLDDLGLAAVEIQHFLHLDPRVIEMVRALEAPYDVYVHDYAWICPRVTLIDGSGRYCGEPEASVCRSCVKRNGSNLREKISVPALRERSEHWLRQARRVIAPSNDTAQRLVHHFPALDIEVRPHATPVVPDAPEVEAAAGPTLRVALIGGIGTHKGYRILLACARDALARRLPLDFVVIGHTENDAQLLKTCKVFVTGAYSEGEALHLLRRERPDLVFLASVWPETWSYVLDEALASGLPIVAFDLGAIAERLRAAELGVLLPLTLTPRQINDRLLQKFVHSSSLPERDGAIMWTPGDERMSKTSEVPSAQPDGFSASVQILPLPPGLYLFSVKPEQPVHRRTDGQLHLPALHVGLGPGVAFDQVEFVAGPSTNGAWLFAHEDLLITKVKGIGATMVLTSVRGASGEVLSIKVERLDTRTNVYASKAAAAPAQLAASAARGAAAQSPTIEQNGADEDAALPISVAAHIRSRGDMTFTDGAWAGRVAPGLWIESFSIRPLDRFTASDIEYKGLTGSGYETAWLSDDEMCGTKGLSVPLVGFAVRLKPSALAAAYDCEYSGYFKSGVTIGALHNGAPCRSTVANDPLEGIQVRITKRPATSLSALAKLAAGPLSKLGRQRGAAEGLSMNRHRDGKSDSASGKSVKSKAPAQSAGNGRSKPQRRASASGRSSRR